MTSVSGRDRRAAVEAWEALYRAQVAVQRQLQDRFPEGLSQSEYDVLFNLFRAPEHAARIRDLHSHLLLTQPSVSRLVDRMVAHGWVAKCSDESDARGTVVTLTAEGAAEFRRAGAELATAIAERMLESLDRADLERLRDLSDALRGDDAPRRPGGVTAPEGSAA